MHLRKKLFIVLQYFLPKHFISAVAGKLANSENTFLKNILVQRFAKFYKVNMTEAKQSDLKSYKNFNAFFTRELKEGARIINQDNSTIISPADGAISEIGNIEKETIIQAKGINYSLGNLLANQKKYKEIFTNGNFATIYLSPKDYHRVHMPMDGKLIETFYVPGDLFSVNETTANNIPNLFARNERLICIFETSIGPLAMIFVGAIIVSGIETVWNPKNHYNKRKTLFSENFNDKNIYLKKGDEAGLFKLGSTVILLTPSSKTRWDKSLQKNSGLKMGERIGLVNS